ncbi:hydroxymethylbilane synthase [Rhabdochlamydiaceae symbiont of Dictyostelium giganteum]|uniref:hydroxymethylbilane synthase n=1 Tax=Rhabdochlamydiaceae symbiont of Dictyostelium giganteum TaxID=3342349 RepID=UPI00384A57CA
MSTSNYNIIIGARNSSLSRAQVDEVFRELTIFFPQITFSPLWIMTQGDKDKASSLKTVDNTSFFTEEIDQAVISKKVRIGIHSAKDLPSPLPQELIQVALTQGLTSMDSLVIKKLPLPLRALIGTSSLRREQGIKNLRQDLICQDIRGTIEERLQFLDQDALQGVVIAECALIRLKLTHLLRIPLPLTPIPLQGKLAVIARKDDEEMKELFHCINAC